MAYASNCFKGGHDMKRVTKRAFTTVIACMMVCLMFVTPVFAASSNFSKTTVKLNAINGGTSRESKVTSGSVLGDNPSITNVDLWCNVASGTDPYVIYVKSPKGTVATISGPSKTGTVSTSAFNGENPSGTWTVWIQNLGVSYNGNIIPASTVTVTLKVAYSY